MQVITIFKEQRPFHPLLGGNVHLDSRSWDYALQPKAVPIRSVRHEASIGVLNQGDVGACTGNAGTSCAYHLPFYVPGAPSWQYTPDEQGALAWYSANTREDDYTGTYEPDDTGSDSTTTSKVAKEAGIVSGYQMAGDLDSSLEALQDRPGITGIPWFTSMFNAPASGLLTVTVSSGLAGGHELCVDEVVAADAPGNGTGEVLVGGPNSWSSGWGADGRWYLKASDWWMLRQQQGDAFFWTAASQPAPTPVPVPPPLPIPLPPGADQFLWDAALPFIRQRHVVPSYKALATELLSWGLQRGFKA